MAPPTPITNTTLLIHARWFDLAIHPPLASARSRVTHTSMRPCPRAPDPSDRTGAALQERAGAHPASELPRVDDHLASRKDGFGHARDLPSFVRVIVHLHMMRLRRERRGLLGIENHDVGVGPRGDGAFLREHAEDLGG